MKGSHTPSSVEGGRGQERGGGGGGVETYRGLMDKGDKRRDDWWLILNDSLSDVRM